MPAIRVDVWGGENSNDHVARYHLTFDGTMWQSKARQELESGFLVNLRVLGPGEGWGPNEDFDERETLAVGNS